NAKIRTAFALATDRDAYVTALGGRTAAQAATSILSQALRAELPNPDQPADPTGTPTPSPEATATTAATATASGAASGTATGTTAAPGTASGTASPEPAEQ